MIVYWEDTDSVQLARLKNKIYCILKAHLSLFIAPYLQNNKLKAFTLKRRCVYITIFYMCFRPYMDLSGCIYPGECCKESTMCLVQPRIQVYINE